MNDQSHLKNPLPPVAIPFPNDCSLISHPDRPRLTAEQCGMTINCLVRDDGPRNLSLLHTTGMQGKPGMEWVEASAAWDTGLYRWCFFVRGGVISNCFLMTTPKGAEYNINLDGGDPLDEVTVDDRMELTRMLVSASMPKLGVEIVPCWLLAINGERPYFGGAIYYSKEEVEEAFREQQEHMQKYSNKKVIEEAQSTEKRISKERATVAFTAKKKGIKKK